MGVEMNINERIEKNGGWSLMYKREFFSTVTDAIQFANEENVKIISLLPTHYNINGTVDRYALVYQEC